MREVTLKIGLEKIDNQEGIIVEALLDSRATGIVMSSEFARKQGFKLKKLERPMQVRNVNGTAFIDDVIVGMETEEGHDELVAEVIKRLEENNLYVKPEKYKWKVREVGFLGVVIGLEGIRMEEEKVKDIFDWPTPKYVKNVQKFLGLANYYC